MAIKLIQSLAEARTLGLSEGFVSVAVDTKTKKIVGYVQGATFDAQAIQAVSNNLVQFVFGEPWGLSVYAINLATAFIALGITSPYAEEWGDHGALITALKTMPVNVYARRVHSEVIEPSEIQAVVQGLLESDA